MEDLSKLIDAKQNSITARDLEDQNEFTYDSRFKNIDNKYQQLFSRSKSKQYTAQILLNKFINEKLTARIKKEPKIPIYQQTQTLQSITNRVAQFSIQSQYSNKPKNFSSQFNSTEQKHLPINYIKTVRNSSRIQKEINMATARLTPISVESFFHKVIEQQTIDQSILLQDQKKMHIQHDARVRNSQTVVDSSTNRMGKTDVGPIPTFDHSFFNKSVYSSQATRDIFIHSGKAKEIQLGYESLMQSDTPTHYRQNTLKQSSNNHYQQFIKKSNDLEKSLKSGSAISEMSKSPNNKEFEVKSNIVKYGKQEIAEKTQNSLQEFDETFSKLAKKLQLSNQKKIEQPFLTGENKVTNDEKLKLIYSSMKFKDDDIVGTAKSLNESFTSDKNRQNIWKQAIINEEERAKNEKDIIPLKFQKFEMFNKPQITNVNQNDLNSPQSRQSKKTTASVPTKMFIPSIKSNQRQSEQSRIRNMTQQIKQRRNIIFFQNIKNQQFGQTMLPNMIKQSDKTSKNKTQNENYRNTNMSIVSSKSNISALSDQSKKIVQLQLNQMDLNNRIRDSHIINSNIDQKDRPHCLQDEQKISFVPQTLNNLKFKSKILQVDLREQQQNQRIQNLIENLQSIKQQTLKKLILKNKFKIVEQQKIDNNMESIIYKGVQEEHKNEANQYETNVRKMFEIILKESESSNEIFYNQTESEFFEQDKFIKDLQITKNDQIQKLRKISNNSDSELIFERLFDYLFQQTIRDKILNHYKEYKLAQAIKNTQEQERLLSIEERRKKLNNPETKRNIQSTIQNIDQRIQIELKRLSDQRNLQDLGIKNFIKYLKDRDISKDISESIKNKKKRMCQIYEKIHNVKIDDYQERKKLDQILINKSEDFKNQTEAIGYAKNDQLISIIQKTKLNQQRDNQKHTQALQIVALNSDENSEALKHFVDEICNDQSMIYERNLLNKLFEDLLQQNKNNLIDSEGTCNIISTQKYLKIFPKNQSDSVTPNTSQRQSTLSFRKPKQISNEASTIKQTLLDFKRLLYPKKVQLKEQLSNYNNQNLIYITDILKLKKSTHFIFKQKNIGELYTGLPDELNSKSNFESAFELPEFVFSGKIIINSMNQQVCPRADMSKQAIRKGSIIASPSKIESITNVSHLQDKNIVYQEDQKQRDQLAEKIKNIFLDKSKKIKKLFSEQMNSKQFYDLSKRGHSYFGDQNQKFEGSFKTPNLFKECLSISDPQENESEDIQTLVQSPMDQIYAYLCACNKSFIVPSPIYSKIKIIDRANQNSNCNLCSLFLYQYPISKDQAIALRDFLISQVQLNIPSLPFDRSNLVNQPLMIHNIILDNCGIGDFELSNILVGLLIQSTIKHFSYFNNEIGPLSIRIFNDLFQSPTQLIEFNLHNIQNSSINFLQQLTSSLSQQKQLVHLRISQVNLKDDIIIQNICLIIENQNKTMYTLDLSGTSLSSKHLNKLAETLLDYKNVLRSLNLSYNLIKNGIDANKYSVDFLSNFNSYIINTEVLNHLDVSGMFLFYDHHYNQELFNESINEKEEFINLFQNLANCKNLQGVHISDNNIEKDQELYDQLCQIFAFKNMDNKNQNQPNDKKLREFQKLIMKIDPSLDPKLFQSQISNQNYVDISLYSDHLLKGMSLKQIQQDKKANLTQTGRGIVRDGHNLENIFVLNRILNQSEFIFNTRHSNQDPYFDSNSSSQWVIDREQKFDCNACQKHKYTIIFFDQSSWQNNINGGLKPIQNPQDIEFIKSNYFKEHLGKKKTKQAPFILASFKNKMNFPNQMITIQLYTLLSIIDLKIITKQDIDNVKEIKRCIFSLIQDISGIQQQLFQESLQSFQFILHDKIHRNDLIDIQIINEPANLRQNQFQQDVFVFADYVPAGHHQILIYCPVTDCIWYKDFLSEQSFKLNFNNEFPLRANEGKLPVIQNIWKQKVVDFKKCPFNMDMQSIILQNFLNNNLKLFIFQSFQRVHNIIENFHVLIIRLFKYLHIEVLLQDDNGGQPASIPNKTFPKIQFKVFVNYFYQNMTMLLPNSTLYFDIEQKVQQTLGNEVIALRDEDLIRQMIFLHAFYASRNKGKMPNVLEVKPVEKEKKKKKGQEQKVFNQMENMKSLKNTLMEEGLDRCELIVFILYLVKLIYNANLSIKIVDNTQKTIKPVSFEEILYQFFAQLEQSLNV